MSGDDSCLSLRAPDRKTIFRPSPLASPRGPSNIERMFCLRLCINQSIRCLHLYRSLYSKKEAPRWLGIWLYSRLEIKCHHTIRLKHGKRTMVRLRRVAGQMGLSPANCRKVMTACIQSVVMFGSEQFFLVLFIHTRIPPIKTIDEYIPSVFPVRCPRGGGTLQGPLSPPPRPSQKYKERTNEITKQKKRARTRVTKGRIKRKREPCPTHRLLMP